MALTETQQLRICQILQITPIDLENQIYWLGSRLTSAIETSLQTEIDRWDDGAGEKFARIHPNIKNFGAEVNPEDLKNDIRANMGSLLHRTDWGSAASGVEFSIVRG